MKFIVKNGQKQLGRIEYSKSEKNFNFESVGANGGVPSASLVLSHALQIDFDVSTGQLLCLWGYSPDTDWQILDQILDPFESKVGLVFVEDVDDNPLTGAGYDTNITDLKPKLYKSGELVIGYLEDAGMVIEFASNTYIGITDGDLKCVIVRPELYQ
jgi:hypothetical protein